MKIQPFIFNWNGQFDRVIKIEKSLKTAPLPPVVINSDDHNTQEGWVNVGDDFWFAGQMNKAIEMFDADIMFHIQGDTEYMDWARLASDAEKYMSYYNAGIYSPNLRNTYYGSNKVCLKDFKMNHPRIKMVTCTDCTVWFIDKVVINFIKEHQLTLQEYGDTGWGYDILFSAISYLNNMPVIRDHSHCIKHFPGRGYTSNKAWLNFESFKSNQPQNIQELIDLLLACTSHEPTEERESSRSIFYQKFKHILPS